MRTGKITYYSSPGAETSDKTGIITELYTAIKEENTNYYFKLQSDNTLYVSSIINNDHQTVMKIGDTVTIKSVLINDNTAIVQSIEIAN